MARHGSKRSRPEELVPGTVRVISVRMDYWPAEARAAQAVLDDPELAYVSRYALGRDYHKVLRGALAAACRAAGAAPGSVRLPRVRRQRAGARERAGAQCGPGLDRQAHQPDRARCRLVVLPRARSSPTCRCRWTHRPARTAAAAAPASRPAPPGRSWRPIGSMPGAASPTSPSSSTVRSRWSCARPSATASTAAMTASWCARGTSLRAPPPTRTSRCATAWMPPRLTELFRWSEVAVRGAHARLGDLPHRLRALVAQHRGGARQCAALGAGAGRAARTRRRTLPRWCASTCTGRSAAAGAARA